MQPRRGLPSHPSLPPVPHGQNPSQYTPQLVASSSAQSNHYWNTYAQYAQPQYAVASHYAQAYTQQGWGNTATNSEGYTISSTYSPEQSSSLPAIRSRPVGQWYQPGSSRCSKPGCQFTGSPKSVEIHMMDRHLIYPPGWEKRKKKDDWDADPSLKGFVMFYYCPLVVSWFQTSLYFNIENPSQFRVPITNLTHPKRLNNGSQNEESVSLQLTVSPTNSKN